MNLGWPVRIFAAALATALSIGGLMFAQGVVAQTVPGQAKPPDTDTLVAIFARWMKHYEAGEFQAASTLADQLLQRAADLPKVLVPKLGSSAMPAA